MNAVKLGQVRNSEFATQGRDFSGLTFGKISPTDIDGFLDFGGRAYVLIEAKYGSAELPRGQKLALTRAVDTCWRGKVPTLLIVGEHRTRGTIDFAAMCVREYYFDGRWFTRQTRSVCLLATPICGARRFCPPYSWG